MDRETFFLIPFRNMNNEIFFDRVTRLLIFHLLVIILRLISFFFFFPFQRSFLTI